MFLLWSKCSGQLTGHTFSLHSSNCLGPFNDSTPCSQCCLALPSSVRQSWRCGHRMVTWHKNDVIEVSSSNPERICFNFPFVLDGRDGFGAFSIPKVFLKVSSHELKEHCNWGEQIWVEANLTWLDVEVQQACRLRTQHFFTPCLPFLGFFLIHAVGGIQNGEIAVLLTSPWKIEINQLLNWSTCFGTLPQAPEDDCSYCFPSADATEEVRWKVKSIKSLCLFQSLSWEPAEVRFRFLRFLVAWLVDLNCTSVSRHRICWSCTASIASASGGCGCFFCSLQSSPFNKSVKEAEAEALQYIEFLKVSKKHAACSKISIGGTTSALEL